MPRQINSLTEQVLDLLSDFASPPPDLIETIDSAVRQRIELVRQSGERVGRGEIIDLLVGKMHDISRTSGLADEFDHGYQHGLEAAVEQAAS